MLSAQLRQAYDASLFSSWVRPRYFIVINGRGSGLREPVDGLGRNVQQLGNPCPSPSVQWPEAVALPTTMEALDDVGIAQPPARRAKDIILARPNSVYSHMH
jgi:hypothetical protein